MKKLTKTQTEGLIEENLKLFGTIFERTELIIGYDLSRTGTGRYSRSHGGVCFEEGGKDIISQLSYLRTKFDEELVLYRDTKKVLIGYERVSAMSHFAGLRAVTMAESLLLSSLDQLPCEYNLLPISSTALKKYITGSGRYVEAKKELLRNEMGLKTKDDPVKHLIMLKLAEDYNLSFIDDNIADAATIVIFLEALKDIVDKCPNHTYEEFYGSVSSLEKSKKDTLISYMSSWEPIKDNKTSYEYGKIRKAVYQL